MARWPAPVLRLRSRVIAGERARLCLILTAFVWGTTFPITRSAVAHASPATLLLLRSAAGALPVIAVAWRSRRHPAARAGVELGLWMWAALATQTIGLTSTTAGRSAFLTAISVVLVAVAEGLRRRRVTGRTAGAVVLCAFGIVLLTYDGSRPGPGDAWTLLCALLYVGLILRMGVHARRVELLPFVAWQLVVTALASTIWAASSALATGPGLSGVSVASVLSLPWLAGAYLGLAATLLTTLLQATGQRDIEPTESVIIYSLEPVCAFAFGCVFLGEPLGAGNVLGGALVVVACVLCQDAAPARRRPRDGLPVIARPDPAPASRPP